MKALGRLLHNIQSKYSIMNTDSKKILSLPIPEGSIQHGKLYRNIYRTVNQFMQLNKFALRTLPKLHNGTLIVSSNLSNPGNDTNKPRSSSQISLNTTSESDGGSDTFSVVGDVGRSTSPPTKGGFVSALLSTFTGSGSGSYSSSVSEPQRIELTEQLKVYEVQKAQIEIFLTEAITTRKLDEAQSLKKSLREIELEIRKLQRLLT